MIAKINPSRGQMDTGARRTGTKTCSNCGRTIWPFRRHCPKTLTIHAAKYNHMVLQQADQLDAVFSALADPTRRATLSRLAAGDASVNELCAPFAMRQPPISKHLKVLERAGLIGRSVTRQQRPARLKAAPMAEALRWLEDFKQFWASSFDQLDTLREDLKRDQTKREADNE